MNLYDKLRQFKGASDEVELQKLFGGLASAFLYGGYIKVRDDYKVYIRTVEFYFHSEKMEGVHDPIVYHRNKREFDGNLLMELPYFPMMTLHAHDSGFDISFENKTGEYRASVLIRSYEVKDVDGMYLKWEKTEMDRFMFVKHCDYQYNNQSTYLKKILNGFTLGNDNDVKWVDAPRIQSEDIPGKPRQNVFQSESEWEYKAIREKRCQRKWSFTRQEKV